MNELLDKSIGQTIKEAGQRCLTEAGSVRLLDERVRQVIQDATPAARKSEAVESVARMIANLKRPQIDAPAAMFRTNAKPTPEATPTTSLVELLAEVASTQAALVAAIKHHASVMDRVAEAIEQAALDA